MKFPAWGRYALILAAVLLVLGAALPWLWPWWQEWRRVPLPRVPCEARLTRAELDRSLQLGSAFLLSHQRPEGRFDYEYDWRRRVLSSDDNQVRQAGAAWGLALIQLASPAPELVAGLARALDFFAGHSALSATGGRYVVYPGDTSGSTGTVALVALALIEGLRSEGVDPALRARWQQQLDEYLRFLVALRRADGLWPHGYRHDDGAPLGRPSSYYDGEALLALVKAARYLGHADLQPLAIASAEQGYQVHVAAALRLHPDSDETKGYYQWSSMAFFELWDSGWPGTERFGDRVLELADWMIDVHRTLARTRNTGYALEGIVHAYELARRRGDIVRADWYACAADRALGKLTSWQVGHPLASPALRQAGEADPQAAGGVQNHHAESTLRIDVTQHQMHAVILARRYLYPAAAVAP